VLVNVGLERVGTHLKGPVTILLVLVGHSEGATWAGRGWWAQAWANDGGGVMRKQS